MENNTFLLHCNKSYEHCILKNIPVPQPSSVLLRFLRQPEYVSVGARLLLRQGSVRGVGHLQQVFRERPFTVLKV
jgi:hypothetical protein